jgi:hypothetical protein
MLPPRSLRDSSPASRGAKGLDARNYHSRQKHHQSKKQLHPSCEAITIFLVGKRGAQKPKFNQRIYAIDNLSPKYLFIDIG